MQLMLWNQNNKFYTIRPTMTCTFFFLFSRHVSERKYEKKMESVSSTGSSNYTLRDPIVLVIQYRYTSRFCAYYVEITLTMRRIRTVMYYLYLNTVDRQMTYRHFLLLFSEWVNSLSVKNTLFLP